MSHSRSRTLGVMVASSLWLVACHSVGPLTPVEQLGKRLFFDTSLSTPPGQSCAACHDPKTGFTGPDASLNAAGSVYPGAVPERFSNRKPPTSAYGGRSPVLRYDKAEGVWVGGMFWDGRATGAVLNDPLAEQAQGPLLNPVEQNLPDAKAVCVKVKQSPYAPLFEKVWGPGALDTEKDVDGTFARIARSMAAYERSVESDQFSSKYDAYLSGKAQLTDAERLGLRVFEDEKEGKCALCHVLDPPLFTDFTYDNIGMPRNPANPFYKAPRSTNPLGDDWVDEGLGGYLKAAGYDKEVYEPEIGKMKVPTLRNVDLRPSPAFVKAFGHNGYFKSLESIVHFYNTRDVKPKCEATPGPEPGENCWPAPEVAANVNVDELGNLGLTPEEERALVAFMKTLSDGWWKK
jgi:cytochrome c peroxidase